MNCKPGDLAIIVKEFLLFFQDYQTQCDYYFKFPVGTIVKVLKENKDNFSDNISNNKIIHDGWTIDKVLTVSVVVAHCGKKSTKSDKVELDCWCPDDVLEPLRDFEDDENISEIKEEEMVA